MRPPERRLEAAVWKAPLDDESAQDLRQVRARAQKLGIAIRKQRPSRRAAGPLYRLLDRHSGELIRADLLLVDVPTELFWIVRERRRALEQPVVPAPGGVCPSCSTPRIGFFRYCKSCGLDYEAERVAAPPLDTRDDDILWLHDATAAPRPEPAVVPRSALLPAAPAAPAEVPADVTAKREKRLRYRVSPSEVAVGVVVGALIGVIATIVGARS